MTKDFKRYTAPYIYFAPKSANGGRYSVIDETILKVTDNKYYMFFKDEREPMVAQKVSKNIHFVFGTTPQGPWWVGPSDEVSYAISGPGNEGPTAIIIGDEVRVYFDTYNSPESTDRIYGSKLTNFLGDQPPVSTSWSKGDAMKTATGDFLPGHGSISEVPRAKVLNVLYGINDPTVYKETWTHPTQSEIYVEEPAKEVLEYPMGQQNHGCGTGFGLAFLPPIVFRATKLKRKKRKSNVK